MKPWWKNKAKYGQYVYREHGTDHPMRGFRIGRLIILCIWLKCSHYERLSK